VDDVGRVRRDERVTDRQQNTSSLVQRQAAAREAIPQALASQELADDEDGAIGGDVRVDHGHRVRVHEPTALADLGEDPLLIGTHIEGEGLRRDGAVGPAVDGLVHHPRSTPTDLMHAWYLPNDRSSGRCIAHGV
jgi:hypothetical protein